MRWNEKQMTRNMIVSIQTVRNQMKEMGIKNRKVQHESPTPKKEKRKWWWIKEKQPWPADDQMKVIISIDSPVRIRQAGDAGTFTWRTQAHLYVRHTQMFVVFFFSFYLRYIWWWSKYIFKDGNASYHKAKNKNFSSWVWMSNHLQNVWWNWK